MDKLTEMNSVSFKCDSFSVFIILFQFAIIGEAIIHINNEILSRYTYPWHKIRGFRNFILHEYHAIEGVIIWDAIQYDLEELKKVLEEIVEKEF